MVADEPRFCQYRKCGCSIDHLKSTAIYCSPIHKAAEHRARREDPPGTTYPVGKPYAAVQRLRRGRNRQGSGTRLYLVGEEAEYIAAAVARRRRPPLTPAQRARLREKLETAKARLAA